MWAGHAVGEDERLDRREARRVLRRALRLLSPYRREAIIAALTMVGFTAATVAGPAMIRYGVDQGLSPHHHSPAALNRAAIGYAIVALSALLLSLVRSCCWSRVLARSSFATSACGCSITSCTCRWRSSTRSRPVGWLRG
jgi:hypothetical protein